MTGTAQFPPISDKINFPLLAAGFDLPCAHLMCCDGLTFFAARDSSAIPSTILEKGLDWHLYGDTRWPSLSSWVEINTAPGGFTGHGGDLVITYEIPDDEPDPFEWIARNGPLSHVFPKERSDAVVAQRFSLLQRQKVSTEQVDGPSDSKPRLVQCYCIYRNSDEVRLIASYTDLLNGDGVPIPRYRMANVEPQNIEICRFTLHALFRLNEARLNGLEFTATPQIEVFKPVRLCADEENPSWARFHPLRVLRTRPSVRAIPTPDNLIDGIMRMETVQQIMEARRREANFHMLPFARDVRPRQVITGDTNACMAAFGHRANGGATYALPDRLVEEFDNTDCTDIRMGDIVLPFSNLFLKFTPPRTLFLAEGAPVDGCYVVRQGDEYLISLTSHWSGLDYSRSLSVACLDQTFSIHLPMPTGQSGEQEDLYINDAVELGIKEFLESNAPPTDDQSQTVTRPDGHWLGVSPQLTI